MFSFLKKDKNLSSEEKKQETDITSTPLFEEKVIAPFELLPIEQLEYLEDNELYEYLKKAWGIEKDLPVKVWGYVSSSNSFYKLNKVRNLIDNNFLEYPISNLGKEKIKDKGIFLEYSSRENPYNYKYISCTLILSSKKEREKKNNPLLLQVDKKNIEVCNVIPLIESIEDTNGNSLIEESIVKHLEEVKKERINKTLQSLDRRKKQMESEVSLLASTKEQEERNIVNIQKDEKESLLKTHVTLIKNISISPPLDKLY